MSPILDHSLRTRANPENSEEVLLDRLRLAVPDSQHQGQNPDYAADNMTHFDTPGNPKQSGGIFKVDEEDFIYTRGNGGVTLHIYVDSLSDTMEVSLTIMETVQD